jgi:hypothetical protein
VIRGFVAALAAVSIAPAQNPDAVEDGRFSAHAADGVVHLTDTELGTGVQFPASEVFGLRVSRLGRVAWIARGTDGFEVHRADAAGRDMVVDSGPEIAPRSLTVRKTRLRWRNGGRTRAADFHGMRGDKPPIEHERLEVVPGTGEPQGPGPTLWRFGVEVERGLPIDREAFARSVERILFDRRGWLGPGSRIALQRVDQPPFDFRVTLARPRTTDYLCLPLNTGSRVSCENRGRSVLNWLRWSTGSPYWRSRRPYLNYLVNHEVGHSLGHGHRFCGGRGRLAPIMQQGTGPTAPCRHAQWPQRFERRRSGTP